ncbi:hypothetical protein [Magnetospirillum sp. SS-4]|uniref:hypothetical protein n=1 Tax=Magnetospirillum sp. SS-4 TaxID=2681465 RepID=UPI0013810AE3|nr:hypothetical protein [Magnetospirillum sp. SS-4]CAA7612186.1 conserved hypothetical protein [Magnetospirillum sp. SS-4]
MGLSDLWRSIRRRFSRLAEEEKPDERPRADGRRPIRMARRSGYLSVDSFADELVRMKEADAAGQHRLHVFSLTDFRQAVGGKWEKLGGLVEVAVESIIRRHVDTEKDIFTRLDAEIACLALPNSSRSETRTRVAAIARDIAAHLFGDAVIDGRRPQVWAANMPIAAALTEDGDMDRAAIEDALAKAGAALAAGLGEAGGAEGAAARAIMAAPHRATLATLMADDPLAKGADAPRTVFAISGGQRDRADPPSGRPDWAEDQGRKLTGADAPRSVFVVSGGQRDRADPPSGRPDWVEDQGGKLTGADAPRRVMTVGAGAGERPAAAPSPTASQSVAAGTPNWLDSQIQDRGAAVARMTPESSLTLVWSPTWVTSRRAIGAFHARVIRVDKEGAPSLEGVNAYAGLAPIEVLTLDRFTATQAAKELKALFFGRQKVGLTVPVHWMSLAPRWRDCIRIPFEDCPPVARQKQLKMEVFGLSPSVPPHALRRMFEPLERVGCDVMARLPLSAVDMIPSLSFLKAVGVDLAELGDDERVGDDELFARLELFRETARKSRIACYVWGVRRRPLIARVVQSGFSLVNGPGVMCDLGHPQVPKRPDGRA